MTANMPRDPPVHGPSLSINGGHPFYINTIMNKSDHFQCDAHLDAILKIMMCSSKRPPSVESSSPRHPLAAWGRDVCSFTCALWGEIGFRKCMNEDLPTLTGRNFTHVCCSLVQVSLLSTNFYFGLVIQRLKKKKIRIFLHTSGSLA